MTQQSSDQNSPVNTRGAVDLSGLGQGGADGGAQAGSGRRPSAEAQTPQHHGTGTDSWVLSMTPAQLQQLIQLSAQVPVVVLIHSDDEISMSFYQGLADAVDAQQGRVVLGALNASQYPEIAQQAGSLPVVTAFLSGQAIGEFDSSVAAEQLPQVITQILQAAVQSGITGTVPAQSTRSEASEQQSEEPELPPLHAQALAALENEDFDGAAAAYQQALREKPDDQDAARGLSQVSLIQRTRELDHTTVRQQAAENPSDIEAQKSCADVDVLGGHVEDAFTRLIRFVQSHAGDDREAARKHCVELFGVVGDTDPRVVSARRKLSNALF